MTALTQRYTVVCHQADVKAEFFRRNYPDARELAYKFARNPDNLKVVVVGEDDRVYLETSHEWI